MSSLGVNMCLHEHAETGLSKLHLEMGQILELHEKEYRTSNKEFRGYTKQKPIQFKTF